jgi:two-component system, OmpR family, phosphate regulon response regulator PhoB
MKPFVLIAEDEDSIRTLLQYNLLQEGFEVAVTGDGEETMILIAERQPDLLICDWMMPRLSGIEIVRRLRSRVETRNLPIIMLTARGEETDRIRGLETGADDYVTKPFSVEELIARVRAVLRRIRPGLSEDLLIQGHIAMDRHSRRVSAKGRDIHLGPTEYRLLEHFMQNPKRVFTREQLLDSVWGSDVYVEVRTVDVHVGRLRKALKVALVAEGLGDEDPIRTVRSAGYSFE